MKHFNLEKNKLKEVAARARSYVVRPQFILLAITLLLLFKVLTMGQLVYGDIPYFDVAQSKVNFLFAWGPEQLGTSVRQSLNTLRDQIILSVSPTSYVYYFIKYVLPLLLIPITYFYIFRQFGMRDKIVLVIASLFPLLTPVAFGDFLTGQTFWIYLTVPWVFYFAIKLFCLHEFTIRNTILLAIMLFLSLGVLPPIIIPLFCTVALLALVAMLLTVTAENKTIILRYAFTGIATIGIFALLAAPYMLIASSGQQSYTPPSLLGDYYHNYSGTHFLNVFRLAGNNGSGQNTLGYNSASLSNSVGYLVFLLTVIGSVILGLRKKIERYQMAILTCLLVLLLLIGFMDFLATEMTYGAQLFQSQWIVSTIRNPSKLYVLILPLFAFLFAFCLQRAFALFTMKQARIGVAALVVCMLGIYGWPALRGDMGLLYNREEKAASYKKDPLVQDIVKQVPDQSRSILIPSTHHEELNYQNINPGFNVLRLEGGLPQTSQFVKQINSSLNERDDYFFRYLTAAGVQNVIAKKDSASYKAALFSIFPAALSPQQTNTFLQDDLTTKRQTDAYWHYSNRGANDLIFSAEQITRVANNTTLRAKAPFLNHNSAVIDTDAPAAYKELITSYKAEDTSSAKSVISDGKAQLHSPSLILVDLYGLSEAGNSYVVFDIINPVHNTIERSIRQETPAGSDVMTLDGDHYTFSSQKKRIALRAGEYTIKAGTLENMSSQPSNASFTEGIPKAGDASPERGGDPGTYTRQAADGSDGSPSVTLGTTNHRAYIERDLPVDDLSQHYMLRLDYKNHIGDAPTVALLQGQDQVLTSSGQLDKQNAWNTHETYFAPNKEGKRSVKAFLYTDATEGKASENSFDNLRLYKITLGESARISLPNYASDYPLSQYTIPSKDPSQTPNLLSNGSFEQNDLWGDAGDASANASGKADIQATQTTDSQAGRYALKLASRNHTAYVARKVSAYKPNTVYKLSFHYKHVSGKRPSFSIWQHTTAIARPSQELKASAGDWQYFETYFIPDPTATNLTLYLYSASSGENTINLYDDVRLETSSLVSTYLTKEVTATRTPTLKVTSVQRINPTLAKVKVSPGQGLLVFNESFHKGWKAYVADNDTVELQEQLMTKSLGREIGNHTPVNSFANGWWVDSKEYGKESEYTILLAYTPQKNMFFGFVSTGITSVALITFLIVNRKRHKSWQWQQ